MGLGDFHQDDLQEGEGLQRLLVRSFLTFASSAEETLVHVQVHKVMYIFFDVADQEVRLVFRRALFGFLLSLALSQPAPCATRECRQREATCDVRCMLAETESITFPLSVQPPPARP